MTEEPTHTTVQSKMAWRWLLTFTGLICALVAGAFADNVALILAVVAGVLLGIGILLFLAGARSKPREASDVPQAGPGIGQGCVIVVSGVLLAFFSCLGAFTIGNDMAAFMAAASIAGVVLAIGGTFVVFVRFLIRNREE